jgi:hypothetical protein
MKNGIKSQGKSKKAKGITEGKKTLRLAFVTQRKIKSQVKSKKAKGLRMLNVE